MMSFGHCFKFILAGLTTSAHVWSHCGLLIQCKIESLEWKVRADMRLVISRLGCSREEKLETGGGF